MNIEPGTRPSGQEIETAIKTLRGTLRGEIMTEADAGYDAARAVWNAMIDRRPVVIVQPKGVADVIEAVSFAGTHGLPVSIKGGGHNVAGHAVCDDGLMIDLSLMRAVRVAPRPGRGRLHLGRSRP
jgi:FAD/FMN-containing dehydrogenase